MLKVSSECIVTLIAIASARVRTTEDCRTLRSTGDLMSKGDQMTCGDLLPALDAWGMFPIESVNEQGH